MHYEVGDLSNKSVDVVNTLDDAIKDSRKIIIVEFCTNSLNNVLKDTHTCFKTFPALSVMHRFASLVRIDFFAEEGCIS